MLQKPSAEAKIPVGAQSLEVEGCCADDTADATPLSAVEELLLGRARLGTPVRVHGLTGKCLNYQKVHSYLACSVKPQPCKLNSLFVGLVLLAWI